MLIRNGYRYQAAKNTVAKFMDEIDMDYMEDEDYTDE
jgi:hypothetical protein